MKRLIFILAACLALTACDRSDKPAVDAVAQCVVAAATPAEREALGRRVDTDKNGSPVHLARFDQLACRGAKGILDNDATLDAQGLALAEQLLPSRDFRLGMQFSIWQRGGRTPEVAEGLASLAVQSGTNTVTRAWARSCKLMSDDAAAAMRDLEAPYLTAYVGIRGWAADAKQARDTATALSDQGKNHALLEADSAAKACNDVGMRQRYEMQVAQMKAFSQGTNALVPGCRVQPQGDEFILDCSASARP